MQQIKVGTIGYGGAFNMGKHHLHELILNKGFVPTAVCDLDPERVKVAEKDFPRIQTYTGVGAMLKESGVQLLVIIFDWGAHFVEWMLQVMDYEMLEISGYQVNEV